MIDMNALIAQLQAAGGSPETVDQLMAALNSSGTLSGGQLSRETRARIERAAAAMQAGDYNSAKAAAAQLMNTPDGAQLASPVLHMLGQ